MEITEVLVGKQIHHAGMRGEARCGATGRVRISYSGALLLITCPECRKFDEPDREAQLRSIAEAAAAFRAR